MNRNSIFLIFVGCLLVFGVFALRSGKWDSYYKNKLYQTPQELVKKAASTFQEPGIALDLGCGVGNETAFLLQQGWIVYAVDAEAKAINTLKARHDLTSLNRLITLKTKFDGDLDWEALPSFDLICVCKALPYCEKAKLLDVVKNIHTKIQPGGKFAGHLFGVNCHGYSADETQEMSFLSREEAVLLFKDFDVESFQEVEEEDTSGTGKSIHTHVYEIIARKRLTSTAQ
ncbi:MAG: class I SAM-dependent methyltransferase [Parachlamydiales bacterium]|jgi:2-polyprenyl-3-methyl-5-hydroxy-6-metoxy-1,4-benzoquinol methylase